MNNPVFKKNNINIFGKGTQPMLFAHGYGCNQEMWRLVTPAFEEDYQIHLFDHVGSGESQVEKYDFSKYKSLQGYADDLIDICDSLSLKRSVLVAHSVSSMIATLAAVSRPDLFDKLIMIGPSPRYINEGEYFGGFDQQDIDELIETLESNYLGWSSFITPVIVGNPEKEEYSNELHTSFCSMDPAIAKHFAKVTFTGDNRQDLQKLKTPTLIIQTHPDVIAPKEVGNYVHSQISNSELVQLDCSGHCPHLTAPDLVIEAIRNFLKT